MCLKNLDNEIMVSDSNQIQNTIATIKETKKKSSTKKIDIKED